MLEMMPAAKKSGMMNRVANGLTKYVEVNPELFGVKFNLNTLFDDLLKKNKD